MFKPTSLVFWLVAVQATAFAYKAGPDPGYTGAPGEQNCTSCHAGTALNSPGGSVKVEIVGVTAYVPGKKHTVRITLAHTSATRWGFELTARFTGTTSKAGAFNLMDPVNTRKEVASGLEFVTHTEAGTRAGQANQATWDVEWEAPPEGAGSVTFYVAGNAANQNNAETGDRIYTASTVALEDKGAVITKSYAMPQIAFGGDPAPEAGGSWSTQLFFTNSGASTANFTVDFYNNTGTPMPVPFGPSTATSVPVTVAQGATTKVDLAGGTVLTQGWASVTIPTGVSGFAIFRQTVTGRATQEAVVPFSDDSKQSYVMVWDDSAFTTVMAVSNPSSSPVVVNLTARNAAGTQMGTGTVNLGPKSKEAFILRDKLNLPQMQGAFGSIDVSVSSGQVALLGLRFSESAFTTIIPAEK